MPEAQTLQVGDRVIVSVLGVMPEPARKALDAASQDRELEAMLIPSPTGLPSDRSFGDVSALGEFLVASSSGITVEALAAIFRAVFYRVRLQSGKDLPQATTEVSVRANVSSDGVIELSVTLRAR